MADTERAARLIVQRARTIMQTLPPFVPKAKEKKGDQEKRRAEHAAAQRRFIEDAQTAVRLFFAWLPPSSDVERRDLSAHRPSDVHRHVLIGDLYDAYMTVRGDELKARGFIPTANAVLKAVALPEVTDHDLVALRKQREPFNKLQRVKILRLPKSRDKEK